MSSLRLRKRRAPNVVRGGRAIPLDNNGELYYLQGRSHAQGGIDIGRNPRTGIEAEGGEIVQMKPNELRVLSAQDFIGGGVSPAKQVLAGADPDKVFNEQERFKDRHRLNDDGSKYENGGDRKVRAFYSSFNPTDSYPQIGNYLDYIGKTLSYINKAYLWGNPDKMDYTIGDDLGSKISDAAFRKRLGLSYDKKYLIDNEDGSVSLPKEAFKDVNLDKKSIQARIDRDIKDKTFNEENYINDNDISDEDKQNYKNWNDLLDTRISINKHFLSQLDSLDKKPIVYSEVYDNSYDKALEHKNNKKNISKLNALQDFTIYPKNKNGKYKYRDVYDFNQWDWLVPGKSYEIKGEFKNGGMIATINGNVKNGLITTPRFKNGGGIYIKPSKRGTFTAAAKAHGKSVQGFASQVLANKDNYSSAMVKKANFARNASKWNHKACGGRKKAPNGTVTDVNTRGVSAPDLWTNTIGQDNAVYDMAANNTIEGNKMAMRHADMREDLNYQSGSGRAIRGSGQIRQYQKDFQNRFWDANRLLHNATDPAGITGDNQSGESNDDIWGEKTNVRTPYGLYSDANRQMWNDRGFLTANYKGNTVLAGRIANLNNLELPTLPNAPKLTAPIGELAQSPSPTGGQAKTPQGNTPQSPTPRKGIEWNDDLTSALANGLGSLGAFGADLWGSNLRSWTPYLEAPVKLKTNYNINPQLDRIRESSQEAYRDIDANTASSSTALARKQRVRNQAQSDANEQWATKENKETELINRDKLNRQGVRNRNTNRLNYWAESDANIANTRRRLRGAAWSNLFNNLNQTVQGYIGRRDQRRRDEATERMFNRAYPHGAAMARNIQSRESSGDATIPSLATNPIAIAGRIESTDKKNTKRCGGKIKRK